MAAKRYFFFAAFFFAPVFFRGRRFGAAFGFGFLTSYPRLSPPPVARSMNQSVELQLMVHGKSDTISLSRAGRASSCVRPPVKRTAPFSEAVFGYRWSFPLPPPDRPPPNSDNSDEVEVRGRRWSCRVGAAITGRCYRFRLRWTWSSRLGAAAFLDAFLLGADFFATFLAVFFSPSFSWRLSSSRSGGARLLCATFLRVIFDLVLTRAFLDFAAFFFPRFTRCFLCSHCLTPPVGPVCLRANPILRSRKLKTLVRVSASVIRDYSADLMSATDQPPSTRRLAPVISEAAGEARKTTAPVTSEVSPTRPSGMLITCFARSPGRPRPASCHRYE